MSVSDEHASRGIRIEHLPSDGSLGFARVYPRNAVIWVRGEPLESVFFVRRGQVHLAVEDDRGRQIVVRKVEAGEPFGLVCFSPPRRRAAPTTAIAVVRSEVIEIACEDFTAFLQQNQAAVLATLTTLGERLAFAEERLRVLVQHDAENRICALLEQLANRGGRWRRDVSDFQQLQLTHAELAERAGLSRAHVSVVMARLREQNYVRYDRKTPLLVNVAALMQRSRALPGSSKKSK